MTRIKAAFWDWNGTLWQDTQQWLKATKASYSKANIAKDRLTSDYIRTHFDVPVKDFIYKLGAKKDISQDVHQIVISTFLDTLSAPENKDLAYARADARKCINRLQAAGIEQRIVSNHPIDKLAKELKRANLSALFQTVCGTAQHADIYHKANKHERVKGHLEELGIEPSQAIIIADTREEIRIAKEFGLVSIAITGGYNTASVLRDEKPDYIINELKEIYPIIGLD